MDGGLRECERMQTDGRRTEKASVRASVASNLDKKNFRGGVDDGVKQAAQIIVEGTRVLSSSPPPIVVASSINSQKSTVAP